MQVLPTTVYQSIFLSNHMSHGSGLRRRHLHHMLRHSHSLKETLWCLRIFVKAGRRSGKGLSWIPITSRSWILPTVTHTNILLGADGSETSRPLTLKLGEELHFAEKAEGWMGGQRRSAQMCFNPCLFRGICMEEPGADPAFPLKETKAGCP